MTMKISEMLNKCFKMFCLRRTCVALIGLFLLYCLHVKDFNYSDKGSQIPRSANTQDNNNCSETDAMEGIPIRSGIRSKIGDYILHPHSWPAVEDFNDPKVCLATFTSINQIHWLVWLMQAWSGPLSVAVYTPRRDFFALGAIIRLFDRCIPELQNRVSYHVTYPIDARPTEDVDGEDDLLEFQCSSLSNLFEFLKHHPRLSSLHNNGIPKLPQNHLRNLARQACDTPYVLNADVDMIPSLHMYERLNLMLQSAGNDDNKRALIVPVYEIDSSLLHLPGTKPALMQMVEKKLAQRYHIQIFEKNQGNSKLEIWEAPSKHTPIDPVFWSLDEESVFKVSQSLVLATHREIPFEIMYSIQKYEEYWEPIVIVPANSPTYDERFVGYGFTRNSFIYELHAKGYTFRVLDDAFFCHWGFQKGSTRPRYRAQEINKNSHRYNAFKRELKARYDLQSSRKASSSSKTVRRFPIIINRKDATLRNLT